MYTQSHLQSRQRTISSCSVPYQSLGMSAHMSSIPLVNECESFSDLKICSTILQTRTFAPGNRSFRPSPGAGRKLAAFRPVALSVMQGRGIFGPTGARWCPSQAACSRSTLKRYRMRCRKLYSTTEYRLARYLVS